MDLDNFPVLAHGADRPRVCMQHHGRQHVAVVRMLIQHVVDGIVQLLLVGRQIDELLRATVYLTPFEVHDAAPQGLVGGVLIGCLHGGVDVEAACIGFASILGKHQLAHGLGHILGMHAHRVLPGLQLERLLLGQVRLRRADETVVRHALNDVELPAARALRVADRVVRRGGLGQACQHRGLGDAHILQWLVEIGFAGGGKAVGALAQEDLVHIDLQNLALGQQMLQLEGQQDFVDLAGIGFFRRQVDVARHLHGDRRRSLALDVAQIGQPGAQHALVVDAAVLVETRILDRQHSVDHDLRNVFQRCQVAPLFTELPQQDPFLGKNTQREDGPVVGQFRYVGQVGESHRQGNSNNEGQGQSRCAGQSGDPTECPEQGSAPVPAGDDRRDRG